MTPLDELFMAETMTAMVESHADQSEENSWVGVYEGGDRILPTGDSFTYDELGFSQGMAPVTGTQSPSKPRTALGVAIRGARCYAVKAHVDLPAPLLMMARGAGQDMPDPEGWLASNLKNLTNEVQRTRNYWAAQSLLSASVDLGIFPNADLGGVAAVHVQTYPVETLSALAGWDVAATALRSVEINALKKRYRRDNGFNPGVVKASASVEGYLTGNTQISNPVNGSPTLAQRVIETSYLEGGGVLRFGGLDWEFANDDFYVTDANAATAEAADDATPTKSEVMSDLDLISVLPPRTRWNECFAQVEGRVFMPAGLLSTMAVGSPSSLIVEARGWYAYLELILNPVGIRLHVGWHGNFVQKRRGCVLVFNTTP